MRTAVPQKLENARRSNKKSQKQQRSVEFQNFGFAFSGIIELFHSSPLLYFLFLSFSWAKIASFNVNFSTTSSDNQQFLIYISKFFEMKMFW